MKENKFQLVNHKVKREHGVGNYHSWYRYDWDPKLGEEPRYSFCITVSEYYNHLQVFNRGTGPAGDYVELFIRDHEECREGGKMSWTYTIDLCPHSPKGHTIPVSAINSYIDEIRFAQEVAAEIERRFFNNLQAELAEADAAMPAAAEEA